MFSGNIDLILAAFVATREGKDVREIIGASKSFIRPRGPSITIKGSLGKTIEPSS